LAEATPSRRSGTSRLRLRRSDARRPNFRRRGPAPPEIRGRVAALAVLLLLCAALLAGRAWLRRRAEPPPAEVVVEVRGAIPAPGFYAVPAPARAHDAIRAAGGDPTGMVDATVEPGTQLVVGEGGWRAERMDELLVVGLPVDINSASATALSAVPGIGDARARAIIAERQADGPFASVDELARVKGIGPATVESLRPFLVAE